MKNLTPVSRAYLAAIIDGEGVITISRARKKNARFRTFYYRQRIIVTNSNFTLIQLLKEITGYGCVHHCKKPFKKNWSPIHRWQIVNVQARELLTQIQDYLVIKKEQAKTVLGMPVLPKGTQGKQFDSAYQEQEKAFNIITKLNKRGRKESDNIDINAMNEIIFNHPTVKPKR